MAQVINTNVPSLNAQRNLTTSQSALSTSLQRLSSGLRINSAKDDAAGLAISDRFTTQINGLNQAVRNANDGISLAQTAEGDLNQVTANLQRIRQLTVQAANATNSTSDRIALKGEITQLLSEIARVGDASQFNGTKLFTAADKTFQFQVGANFSAADRISLTIGLRLASVSNQLTTALNAAGFSIGGKGVTAKASIIANFLKSIDGQLSKISGARAALGAIQNRFESVVASLQVTAENLSSSRSRILDADFAQETANLTRNQILQQAGTAMLSQANSLPNNVLTLLR